MVLHYVKIQVNVLMKKFFCIRQRGQVVRALDSQPELKEVTSDKARDLLTSLGSKTCLALGDQTLKPTASID